jgi:hypothetical protein
MEGRTIEPCYRNISISSVFREIYLGFTHFINGSIKTKLIKPDDVETTNLLIFVLSRKEEEMTSERVSSGHV